MGWRPYRGQARVSDATERETARLARRSGLVVWSTPKPWRSLAITAICRAVDLRGSGTTVVALRATGAASRKREQRPYGWWR